MASADDSAPAIVAAVSARTVAIFTALSDLGPADLDAPTLLDGWSRLTIACHLRYGAVALRRMTADAVAGRPTSYYPDGRRRQRPGTLVPAAGEAPSAVVESLGAEGRALARTWASLAGPQWEAVVTEPARHADLGSLPLVGLALLRLTEVEVHGSDLGMGLADWSGCFVDTALPFRLDWLNRRRSNHVAFDDRLEASWLLVAQGGPVFLVTATGADVRSVPADRSTPASAVIEGSRRDLLALLLGRPCVEPLVVSGDRAAADSFRRAFPGP